MILNVNPLANAPTPSQLAFQDVSQFNAAATRLHERMKNGIPGNPHAVVNQQNQALAMPSPDISSADYVDGLKQAIGEDALGKLIQAANILVPDAPAAPAQ